MYGANLYSRYLKKRKEKLRKKAKSVQVQTTATPITYLQDGTVTETSAEEDLLLEEELTSEFNNGDILGLTECSSVLVCTGVYSSARDYSDNTKILLNHNHRDFIMDPELKKPNIIAQNVYDAVQAIFKEEGIS